MLRARRQAIEASLPQLRDMFSAAGLNLGNAQVQADAGGGAWSSGGSAGGGAGTQGGDPRGGNGGVAAQPLAAATSVPLRISRGLLDTFA